MLNCILGTIKFSSEPSPLRPPYFAGHGLQGNFNSRSVLTRGFIRRQLCAVLTRRDSFLATEIAPENRLVREIQLLGNLFYAQCRRVKHTACGGHGNFLYPFRSPAAAFRHDYLRKIVRREFLFCRIERHRAKTMAIFMRRYEEIVENQVTAVLRYRLKRFVGKIKFANLQTQSVAQIAQTFVTKRIRRLWGTCSTGSDDLAQTHNLLRLRIVKRHNRITAHTQAVAHRIGLTTG